MKIRLLNSCFHSFTLKQGTVLIALIQLFTSGFCMILFLLTLEHALWIQKMVERDTEDVLEREALEDHLNSKRMDMAHQTATETLYFMCFGLAIAVIHFISTILLLYGALTNKRQFMTGWMAVMIIIICSLAISLFVVGHDCEFIANLGGKADIYERVFVLLFIITSSYAWFVVYSTFKSLETKEGFTHVLHGVKTTQRALLTVQTSKAVQAYATKPSEV